MLLWIMRGLFGIIIAGMAVSALMGLETETGSSGPGIVAFSLVMLLGITAVGIDAFLKNKDITTISAIYFGLLMGLLLGSLFSMALEPLIREYLPKHMTPQQIDRLLLQSRFVITVVCCYVSMTTLLQTKDEFRFIIPYVEFSKQVKGNKPLVLDTSVIIDGRIADICDTRIIDTILIVPKFVLQELQSIADSSDKLKRNRGRRGLDMLKRMQTNDKVELQMHDGNIPELRDVQKVDERLVVLAKAVNGRVVTNDYNLNKIAQLQGVEVINLNEVANSLKTVALPGESMQVKLVKYGDQVGQAVGYLDDGTMVVVEQGRPHIGHEVFITVTSVLQTPAGRMVFGRIDPNKKPGPPPAAPAEQDRAGPH